MNAPARKLSASDLSNEPHLETSALLSLLERAVNDPNASLDQLDRLATMFERAEDREAERQFNADLIKMQSRLPVLDENGQVTYLNDEVSSTYATWEDLWETVRPVLARHGFAMVFKPGTSPKGIPAVTGVLKHRGGRSEEATMELPPDDGVNRNAIQAIGSSLSYGKRYVTVQLLGLTSRNREDDDGQAAGQSAEEIKAKADISLLGATDAFPVWKKANRTLLGALTPQAHDRVIQHYLDALARVRAATAPVLRSDEGAVSKAPAFLQASGVA